MLLLFNLSSTEFACLKRRVKVVIKLDVNPAKESKQPCSGKNTTEKRGKQNIWTKFRLFLEF